MGNAFNNNIKSVLFFFSSVKYQTYFYDIHWIVWTPWIKLFWVYCYGFFLRKIKFECISFDSIIDHTLNTASSTKIFWTDKINSKSFKEMRFGLCLLSGRKRFGIQTKSLPNNDYTTDIQRMLNPIRLESIQKKK